MKTLIAAIALAAVCLAAPAAAQPDGDKGRAEVLLREGNALLAAKQYAGALAKFEAAYALYPSPALLLNIGTSLRALGRNADAANAYARWIAARANPQRLAEVEEVLGQLDKKVGRVELSISKPGASVVVDGRAQPAGTTTLRLEPGGHTIVARKEGFADARAEIQAAAGQSQTVELRLEPSGTASAGEPSTGDSAAAITAPPPRDDPGGANTPLLIAGLSTAAVGLVATGVGVKFGLDARRINDELEAVGTANNPDAWTPELLAKQDEGQSAETKMIIFTAAGGAAIIGGAVMTYLGLTAGGDDGDSLAIAPIVDRDTAGWVATGRF